MKRLLDFILALLLLILLGPVMLVIAVAVRISGPGPVVFRQRRVGKDFQEFTLLKFRSMRVATAHHSFDYSRVTALGRILRRTKLDELPQLFNILRGDMSFVGPRPELPEYVESFRADYEALLSVRPGMTDPASIAFHDEERLLRDAADPEQHYRTVILPEKLRLSKRYLMQRTLLTDLAMTVRTVFLPFRRAR